MSFLRVMIPVDLTLNQSEVVWLVFVGFSSHASGWESDSPSQPSFGMSRNAPPEKRCVTSQKTAAKGTNSPVNGIKIAVFATILVITTTGLSLPVKLILKKKDGVLVHLLCGITFQSKK